MRQFDKDMQKLRDHGLGDIAMRVEMSREAHSAKEDWLNEQNERLMNKASRYRMIVRMIANRGDGDFDRILCRETMEQNNDR